MKILGIETSCDETAAAVVEDGQRLLSNSVLSSMSLHEAFGGVVPEIAARSHIEAINSVIETALANAHCRWPDIDGIAVTYGPGLGGSLLIGVMSARSLAITKKLPLYAVDHVMAHVYVNFLTSSALPGYTVVADTPKFPMLAIIVSGGHSQLVLFRNHFDYLLLGRTQDDAIGEAFDKVSRLLGLGYPGGPAVSALAKKGDPAAIKLPIAKMPGYNFSFSGLKTAVLRQAQQIAGEDYTFPSIKLSGRLNKPDKANLAASFEWTACQTIVKKAAEAVRQYHPASVAIAGGVAANAELRRQLQVAIDVPLLLPDMKLCTDNGAMIATLGCFMKQYGQKPADPYVLDIAPNLTI